jgi:hypothetical protein
VQRELGTLELSASRDVAGCHIRRVELPACCVKSRIPAVVVYDYDGLVSLRGRGAAVDCIDQDALGGERMDYLADDQVEQAIAAAGGKVVRMPGRFAVISGGRPASAEPKAKMWLCRTCEDDIGVATSVVEPVWQGPLRENGRVRLSSGTKRVVCSHCKMRGKFTFVD